MSILKIFLQWIPARQDKLESKAAEPDGRKECISKYMTEAEWFDNAAIEQFKSKLEVVAESDGPGGSRP